MDATEITALITAFGLFLGGATGLYLKIREDARQQARWRKGLEDEQRAQIQKEREQTDRQINDLVNLLSDELSGFQKRNGELERRHDKLRADHEQMVTAVHQNQETISELEGEVDRLRRELAASQAENQQLREQIAVLTARLAEYEKTNGTGAH